MDRVEKLWRCSLDGFLSILVVYGHVKNSLFFLLTLFVRDCTLLG